MATKVKPTRLNITGTPQVGQVPTYVDKNTFAWGAGGGGGASFGRFLSLRDSTTGMPISFPEATPYNYLTGDYFIVETVSSATPPVNYRPTGSSYTGAASSVTESDEVEVGDTYVYDGTTWLLQSNHGKTVTFANIAGDPYDNANLDSALDAKQDVLVSGTNIKTVNNNSLLGSGDVSVGDMKYTDYNWTTLTGNSVTLALNSQITPAANFTINAPGTIKDGQEYILRVTSGGTVYAITLGTNMSNPNNVDTTLTANSVDQFVFLAVGGQLELQPRDKDTTYTASTGISISAQNEISNTGVLSVNGNTGAVTVATYTAGEGIEIKNGGGYTDMQGPAPTGFHVPSSAEWQELLDMMTTAYGDLEPIIMQYALKMPLAGARTSSAGDVGQQNAYGMYWTSSTYENNLPLALTVISYYDEVSLGTTFAANAYSIRAFKDTPVIPDDSWSGDGTVYWSSSLGLISISSDGTNWITMQDKNLGATTTFNNGDTLTEANSGGYFQWGNNYMFPWTGTVTTSSTLVDASGYGPGNYYNSSTFITNSKGSRDRSSVANNNLWGGVTGLAVEYNNAITNTGVLSVNGQTGNITGMIQNDTTGTTTTVAKIWAGSEVEYSNLGTHDSSTIYHIY